MPELIDKRSKKAGLPPGTPVYTGKEKGKVNISVLIHDEKHVQEKKVKSIDECFPLKKKPSVTWINVDGVHDPGIIEKIGQYLNLHPLAMEDIVSIGQRPKTEDYGDYIFTVLRLVEYNNRNELSSEQISIIIGQNYVISFKERESDIFDNIRERIIKGKARGRKLGASYLAYRLIDAIVDKYFVVLEKLGEKIVSIEGELVTNTDQKVLRTIYGLKRETILLRKVIWPLRDVIGILEREETDLINRKIIIFLRDLYDHTIQMIDTIEIYRDILSSMVEIYLSSVSNKMNEIMKVLTIISTIFIPLTFITGIYVINFKNTPEIDWALGYPAIWVVMILISLSMILYFKKKQWL